MRPFIVWALFLLFSVEGFMCLNVNHIIGPAAQRSFMIQWAFFVELYSTVIAEYHYIFTRGISHIKKEKNDYKRNQ